MILAPFLLKSPPRKWTTLLVGLHLPQEKARTPKLFKKHAPPSTLSLDLRTALRSVRRNLFLSTRVLRSAFRRSELHSGGQRVPLLLTSFPECVQQQGVRFEKNYKLTLAPRLSTTPLALPALPQTHGTTLSLSHLCDKVRTRLMELFGFIILM